MCFQINAVRPWQKWRWAGDELHGTIVPAARKVPGGKSYDIDLREYLSVENDAIVERTVHRFLSERSDEDVRRFATRRPGDFDFRARCVREWVGALRYEGKGRAARAWLFPAETIGNDGGDCEDLSILTAALLQACGISSYCIRVALGYLVEHTPGRAMKKHHHAWAMYLDEGGAWQILEPLNMTRHRAAPKGAGRGVKGNKHRPKTGGTQVEYVPYLVFNQDHLWRVRSPHGERYADLGEYLEDRGHFWKKFDPAFATSVHDSVYDTALAPHLDSHNLQAIKDNSLWSDVNVMAYDPRDHFDFSYVDRGWEKVAQRLEKADVTQLAYALHAICDFYSHTLWAHPKVNDPAKPLPLYDPKKAADLSTIEWDFSKLGKRPSCTHTLMEAQDRWRGKLISGQWWRWFTTYPDELQSAKELEPRQCLPDHDALSVDSDHPHDGHLLFTDPDDYETQFTRRKDAATRHVEKAFLEWHDRHGDDALWRP